MAVRLDTSIRNAIIDEVVSFSVLGIGTLKIYTGAQPASADSAASGTLLVSILFDNGMGSASNGSASLSIPPESGTASASGTAGWGRLVYGAYNIDGSVGTSGEDFTINSTSIASGDTVTLTAFTLTQPVEI